MGLIDSLFAGGVKGALEGLGSAAKGIREAIVGPELTPEKLAEIQVQLTVMEQAAQAAAAQYDTAQMTGQIELNKIEAADPSLFKSGWRPMVGWVCVAALGYTFLVRPVLPWVIQVAALVAGKVSVVPTLPEVPMGDLYVLLLGMLGLGTMRTFEKLKGASK